MDSHTNSSPFTTELVTFLFSRRETLLNNWRTICENDPGLSKTSMLSREEFNNLIPAILDILEQQLLGQKPDIDLTVAAESHGLHRWQKAHELAESLRELNHLSEVLFEEIKLFRQLFPQSNPDMVLQAQHHILQLMNETTRGSITKHDELQRLEATNRATSLQQALEKMGELSRERGELLRTSSHDLRSGLGLIKGAAQLLNLENMTDEERQKMLSMLDRNLTNVYALLSDLMDLSRLEAGQDPLEAEEFDAANLLAELIESAQPMAAQQGIILRGDGPTSLVVTTDRVKIYRIAQNLLVNALKYTPSSADKPGIVSVSWSAEHNWRWGFSVQDTGPGLPEGFPELLHKQLKPIVEATSVLSINEGQPVASRPNDEHKIPAAPELKQAISHSTKQSEGVGLQIVKRLCELLGASLEIESIAGRGTLFRIRMLMNHESETSHSKKK